MEKFKSHFFGNIHVRVASMIFFFLKKVLFKHVKRVLPESFESKYFSVHIAIFYKFALHSYKIFFLKIASCYYYFFFFYKMHCFKRRRHNVAASLVILVFSIVRGVIRKFAENCYLIALLLSIAMKIHRYELPFIASCLKLKLRKFDVRRMSTWRPCDVILLEQTHL